MSHKEVIGNATLYLGDCREVLPTLGKVDAVVTDPPYGIAYKSSHQNSIDYGLIEGDSKGFEPQHLLSFPEVILWGGNNFAPSLPVGGWIVWDKRLSEAADKILGSPFELAWCSRRKLFKIIRLLHGGAKNADALNGDVANEPRYHPTQKPVRLMKRCLEFFSTAQVVLDPYMGSGSTGIACHEARRSFIGIEIESKYFEIACRRIEQAQKQGRLNLEAPQAKAVNLPLPGSW